MTRETQNSDEVISLDGTKWRNPFLPLIDPVREYDKHLKGINSSEHPEVDPAELNQLSYDFTRSIDGVKSGNFAVTAAKRPCTLDLLKIDLKRLKDVDREAKESAISAYQKYWSTGKFDDESLNEFMTDFSKLDNPDSSCPYTKTASSQGHLIRAKTANEKWSQLLTTLNKYREFSENHKDLGLPEYKAEENSTLGDDSSFSAIIML